MQVTLFLTEGIQDESAQFFLKAPKGSDVEPVGTVTCYDLQGETLSCSKLDLAFTHEPANDWFCHPVQLGANMYTCASVGCCRS